MKGQVYAIKRPLRFRGHFFTPLPPHCRKYLTFHIPEKVPFLPKPENGSHGQGWTSRDVSIAIEDPYETHLNTCRNVKPDRFECIRKQLQLASSALKVLWC